jgi:hypothetical protein
MLMPKSGDPKARAQSAEPGAGGGAHDPDEVDHRTDHRRVSDRSRGYLVRDTMGRKRRVGLGKTLIYDLI